MADEPVRTYGTLLHFVDGTVVHAGPHVHEGRHPLHTHSFFELALVVGGEGVHHSLAGRQQLAVGDLILLRPGVWHEYEECNSLEVYNCCFSADLVQRELAWTREDPLLGYLLWTGPFSAQRRGMLTTHLDPATFAEGIEHLDGLRQLRNQPLSRHRGDIIGRLSLYLSCVARTVGERNDLRGETHPAVLDAMRMMEAIPLAPGLSPSWPMRCIWSPGTWSGCSSRPRGFRRWPTCHAIASSWRRINYSIRTFRSTGSASRSAGRIRTTSPGASSRTTG